jgi:hypothetical protein
MALRAPRIAALRRRFEFVHGSQLRLHVVAHLVGDHVRCREIAGRAKRLDSSSKNDKSR